MRVSLSPVRASLRHLLTVAMVAVFTSAAPALSQESGQRDKSASSIASLRHFELTAALDLEFEVFNPSESTIYLLDPSTARGRVREKECAIDIDDDLKKETPTPGHFSPQFLPIAPRDSRRVSWRAGLVGLSRCPSVVATVRVTAFAENPAAHTKTGDDESLLAYVLRYGHVIVAGPMAVSHRR